MDAKQNPGKKHMNGWSIEMHSTAPLLRYCAAFVCVCVECVAKENAPSINNNKFYSERHSGFCRRNVMLISMCWQISHLAFFSFHPSSSLSNHMRNLYIARGALYCSRTKTKWIIFGTTCRHTESHFGNRRPYNSAHLRCVFYALYANSYLNVIFYSVVIRLIYVTLSTQKPVGKIGSGKTSSWCSSEAKRRKIRFVVCLAHSQCFIVITAYISASLSSPK